MITKETVLQRLIDLNLVTNRSDGERWILEEKLSGFGKTPAQLIREEKTDALLDYIEGIANGDYA